MPRSGDEYALPAGTAAVANGLANSSHVNERFADLEAEQNLVRPISKGGTGASSAAAALVALGVTATAAELNIMDGVTATTAEINKLAGTPAGLTATEIGYLDGVTSAIQAQIDSKQASDADLTALAGLSSTGLMSRTGAGTVATRQIASAGGTVTITNPDGVAGDINIEATSGSVGPSNVNSGSSVDFSVPTTATRIIVQFDSVSLSGTDNYLVQLGDSGGVETTSYENSASSASGAAVTSTSGFVVYGSSASYTLTGEMTLSRVGSSNRWIESHAVSLGTSSIGCHGGGAKTLSAAITTVRITRTGSNTFDGSGVVSIRYFL